MTTTITIEHVDGEKRFSQQVLVSDRALDKVLFGFNVTDDLRVTVLKALCAGSIQMMLDHQASLKPATGPTSGTDEEVRQARLRAAAVAITQMELTQMALVKALFAKA